MWRATGLTLCLLIVLANGSRRRLHASERDRLGWPRSRSGSGSSNREVIARGRATSSGLEANSPTSLEPTASHNALARSQLPQDVQATIELWHQGIQYHITHEDRCKVAQGHRGIRQGCRIAPRIAPKVWTLFTILVMHSMGEDWSRNHTTWFADDALFQAIFYEEGQLRAQLQAISRALWILKSIGMTIADAKCATLLHMGGTAANKVRRSLVTNIKNKPHVRFEYAGARWHLPLVAQHEYLGAVLSYTRMEALTATRRIRAAEHSFHRLLPALTNARLTLALRLRIWHTCVISSLMYAMPQVGLTKAAAHRVTVMYYRQLRHITRSPVHLTQISNAELAHRHGLIDPLEQVHLRAAQQVNTTASLKMRLDPQDVRVGADIEANEIRIEQQLRSILAQQEAPQSIAVPQCHMCPECGHAARSKAALTRHRKKVHAAHIKPSEYTEWTEVDRYLRGKDGLPTCRWCGKELSSWQQLQRHIYNKVCRWRHDEHQVQSSPALPAQAPSARSDGEQVLQPEPTKLEHADEAPGQLESPPAARVEATNELAQKLPPQQVLEALPSLREELGALLPV